MNTANWRTSWFPVSGERGVDVRQWLLIAVEVLFLALFVLGVWLVYWPAALMVTGLAGVYSCERWAASRAADQ